MKTCGHCGSAMEPSAFRDRRTYLRSKYCGMACWRSSRRTNVVTWLPEHGCYQLALRGGARVLFSPEDLPLVASRTWSLSSGYASCHGSRLHRMILSPPAGRVVDHINRNPLDNRRENLRVTDQSVNSKNRGGARRDSKSGVRGVMPCKRSGTWTAEIRHRGKKYFLGRFVNLADAVAARAVAEETIWGSDR